MFGRHLHGNRRAISAYSRDSLKWSLGFVGFILTLAAIIGFIYDNNSDTILVIQLLGAIGVLSLIAYFAIDYPR